MINCYLIGENSTVNTLCDYVDSYPLTELKGFGVDETVDFKQIYTVKPDLIFLDVIRLSQYGPYLSRLRQFASIIILSSDRSEAFEAFEYQALDYMLKPLSFDRFVRCINKYINFSARSKDFSNLVQGGITDSFFIKADSKGIKEILIKCDELVYIEALQNYVMLHMLDGTEYTCFNTLKEMQDGLPERDFSRVHKSFIINDSKIISIEGNNITLTGKVPGQILIGNVYKKAFLKKKNERMIKKHKQTIPLSVSARVTFSVSFLSLMAAQVVELSNFDFLLI